MLLIVGDRCICLNIGDSRAIAIKSNGQVLQLSTDHNLSNQKEKLRVVESGGYIVDSRVYIDQKLTGGINTTRSFGDFMYKQQPENQFKADIVTSMPEITCLQLDFVSLDFLVLGSDGLFNLLGNAELADLIYKSVQEPLDAQKLCQDLTQSLLQDPNQHYDNITIVLIPLTRCICKDQQN